MFPGSIGYQELIVIGVVAVLLFGSRLPEVAKTLGQSYQQFRKGLSDLQSTINTDTFDSNTYGSNSSGALPDYSDSDDGFEEDSGPMFVPPEDDES